MGCCSKKICDGCDYANQKRENEAGLEHRCAFCRDPLPESKEEFDKRLMARIKKNCPVAMCFMGNERYREGNYETALEYFTMAAELGDAEAHCNLSLMYDTGHGVEKDMKKQVYHWEEAAIAGDPYARHNLGAIEVNNGMFERAKKHFIIAANLGLYESLECIRTLYADGHASKEEYANALRACQAAVDETKSEEREVAETFLKALDAARLNN